MNCPNCDRKIPTDSQYCIYCSAQLAQPVVETKPAVGPTQRLDPAYSMPRPPELAPSPAPAPSRPPRARRNGQRSVPTAAIWLIGMGILFLTNLIWPGVLVLVGLTSYVEQEARGKREAGLSSLVFFSGLALLFLTDLFWPGILVLAGAMWLLNSRNGRGWSC